MKTTFLSFLKKTDATTILGGAFLCIVFLFSSCENFLKSQGTADVIQQAIDYANSTKYSIKVDAQKGSGIVTKPAAGEALVKVTDTFNLSFSSESDSQFLKWEAYNLKTGEAFTDNTYLQIENPLMIDTTCTFVKDPEDENIVLAIRAVTAKRPRIVLSTPTYQETGAPRNSNVQILFDKFNMETSLIYYTPEEMQELKNRYKIKDEDFLKGDSEKCGGQYYGYIKNNIKYYKNIQIVSSPVEGSSLTQYYYDPYWEKDPNDMGGRTLVLQVTNPPPPMGVKIYITLAKDFCYFEEGVAVTLREDATITYKTNISKENVKPLIIFPKDSQNNDDYNVIKIKNSENEYISLPYNKHKTQVPANIPSFNDINNITMCFNFSTLDEGGSGIANRFKLCYEILPDENVIELPYLYTTPDTGYAQWSEEYIIPRSTYFRGAGNCCFTIIAIDNDGNETTLKDKRNETLYFWFNLTQGAPNY